MLLLFSALASAVTVEVGGPDSEFSSIWKAYPEVYVEGEVTEFVLMPEYKSTNESAFGDGGYVTGLAFDTEVIIRSSVPGELRVSVPIHAYDGGHVKLVDLDLQASVTSYSDPRYETNQGNYNHFPAMLATGAAHLSAENCRVTGQSFGSQSGGAMAFGADLSLIGVEFSGNTPGTGNVDPNELMNYTVGLRENGDAGRFTLTLIDTVIENRSGPAIGIFSEYNPQDLNITGGRIADVASESAGSALYTYGTVNTTVNGLAVENAGNTAVKLGAGDHDWSESTFVDISGGQGAAFHLSDGGNLELNEVQCTNCYAEQGGGVVFARTGTSLDTAGLTMIGGGGREGAALYGEGVGIRVQRARFCGVSADNGPLILTSSDLKISNSVFRNLPVNSPILAGSGGDLELINNTFVDNQGPVLGGVFGRLDFVNNAVVSTLAINAGESPAELRFAYNLFSQIGQTDLVGDFQAGEGNQINVDPSFVQDFLDDPGDCVVDPMPATGSPLIDAGDPEILDKDGTRSDIGAFGGPGASDSEVTWNPGTETDLTLMGGCSGGSGLAAFLLALPLLGLNRKRRQWAEREHGR